MIVRVLNRVLPPVRLVFFVFLCNVEQKMVMTSQSQKKKSTANDKHPDPCPGLGPVTLMAVSRPLTH